MELMQLLIKALRATQCTLYSGLGIIGGSHSPSMSSSQSSGFFASGSGMFSGLSHSWHKQYGAGRVKIKKKLYILCS